jgi:NTE family protein
MVRGRFWVVLCVLLAGGCAGMHIENTPLQAGDGNPDLRTIDPASADRPVILMTFSGGGSRAAALAESVLRELSQTSYAASDGPHMLTEDVKLISSVSGGSVTAAWFGLRRGPGHWDGDLDGLRSDFLTKDNMATLELDAVNPITWFGLVTGQITRIEAEEALFNARLYHDAPLAALNQPGKPYIVLNATDMAGGETFAMVPRRFDDVCSKYDLLPIATAVSASAAFPILLTPVAFQDYSSGCQGKLRNGEWIRVDLSNPYTPYLNLAEYKDARYSNDLRHGPDPYRRIDFLYFLDGGLADNLGTRSLRSALIRRRPGLARNQRRQDPQARGYRRQCARRPAEQALPAAAATGPCRPDPGGHFGADRRQYGELRDRTVRIARRTGAGRRRRHWPS